ncbi:unnamed protein product [Triticum turgidum subsp. durum]|uniref:Uncharacterized protein n=1 Tax=Triticum turgidum subsp. durum TaxID=4567 RepID=A0A9R1Q3U2_TRITD|nr:unnamed protein product [Triticum turgidum subsp. durum]
MLGVLFFEEKLVDYVARLHGLSCEVLNAYLEKTKELCLNKPAASTANWNLITYGADLLDSQLLEDNVSGGRVLTMLIDQDTPVPVTRLLISSPKQRIQKLILTLAWRSPAEQEMRLLAARIVEQLAGHLNLAHFPGALECISTLFDTSCHNNADQEALHLTFASAHIKQRKRTALLNQIKAGNKKNDRDGNPEVGGMISSSVENILQSGGTLQQDIKQRVNCEELVLTGLRILENLAHDRHNCTLIYNTKDLLSKLLAPVSSNEFVQDIKSNAAWTKVIDGSLEVVSRLMSSPGCTGEEMCSIIVNDRNLVQNLEAVLDMDMKSNNSIVELQMRVIEVLTQLALHHPASTSAEKLIERALHIFLSEDCMKDCLTCEKIKIEHQTKRAKETANRLKEKAGEALAMLSSDSETIKSFTGCKDDNFHRLSKMLMQIEINIGCRISAAVILKHLSNYVQEPTLRKVLAELLHVQAEAISPSTPRCREHSISCIKACRNDIENPSDSAEDKPFTLQRLYIQQCGEGRLQAELLSVITTICANSNLDFGEILMSQTLPAALEDFVVRLKKMVEDNMYATPACLAIQKLTCKMVMEFLQHNPNVDVIDRHNIVGTLLKASETMAGLESTMLFAGIDRDCHGVPLKPLSPVLAKKAEDLLAQRKEDLGINIAPASAPVP